ncbi:uncharacterized protein LOC114290763 [Camellia sinensis]|uniref:uncharacterized protein LOC114290763 n=1 Tax=Camellia sinensis TaxID=4442 RepID=UPI001035FDE9|nr:uncharacterized protein LOC114290763 [Camellia sinensis]
MANLVQEMAGALRESMDILKAEQVARTIKGETRTTFLTNEFFLSNLIEFNGWPNPMKQAYVPRGDLGEQRPQGSMYAITASKQSSRPYVVRATYLIFNTWASVLIDTGASHLFIASAFASMLGLKSEQLESPLVVETLVGGKTILNRGYRRCVIQVIDCRLPFNFMSLNMFGFDVILGMDWLSFYCAIIDCYCMSVTLSGDCFSFLGNRIDRLLPPLYDPRSRGELSSLLVTFLDDGSGKVQDEFPRVVCEYSDAFPEDFTKLLPHQVVEFSIDLVSGMTSISMSPYRFALVELVVLKEQL